jgi:glycosyltransferase involved in cell wall biosynthesis
MRVLVLSAMFPPNAKGGAEISAFNLASWLAAQGHTVGVIMAAKSSDDEQFGIQENNLTIWRVLMPRPYPVFLQGQVTPVLKPLWHVQDHFDPRNASIVGRIIDEFKPDFCNVHYLQGLGHNILAELGKRDIPVMYVMPDLAVTCVRTTMFVKGTTCEQLCVPCKISSRYKLSQIRKVRRIGFCSPSRSNLERNMRFQALSDYPTAHILNANKYPSPEIPRHKSDIVRFVYAGRLHPAKGVDVLLQAAESLAGEFQFHFKIVGGGGSDDELRARFGGYDWVDFTGHLTLQQTINQIASSDVLCIPSIWMENSPGVVIQALGLGVPVIGSNVGGIPELVLHEKNGLLVEPGDVEAWRAALLSILREPGKLDGYRASAIESAAEFEQSQIGQKYLGFMDQIRNFNGVVH